MARRLVLLWLGIAVLLAVVSFASASCQSYPDERECRGDKLNVYESLNLPEAGACTICLQRECCDAVGTCNDTEKCADHFKATQGCLIEAGPGFELECKAKLVSPQSNDLYNCVRDDKHACGPACGVPNCKLNSAVPAFGTASCDRCVGSACCEQVNKCYENRPCKLFLECITEHCPNTLGPTLALSGAAPKEELEKGRQAVCRGEPPPVQLARATCLQKCLFDFTGGGTPDDTAARCLAFGVYTCAAGAGCGRRCTNDGGIITQGAYPEDLDAGAP